MDKRTAIEIMTEAIGTYKPVAIYSGYSGGNDSAALTHWMMNNIPGCKVFHINTGVGIPATREHVIKTSTAYGWPLTIINSLEDCGQDYDALVRRFGFPGPPGHRLMYRRLKERAVRMLVRRAKTKRMDRVLIATGLRHDESLRRMGYGERVINRTGAQIWVNPVYWQTKAEQTAYIAAHAIPINPISKVLGMSGECLCGAFAHKGELEEVRAVCPELAERFDRLHAEVKDSFPWGWEERPTRRASKGPVGPMCGGCEKSAVVQQLIEEVGAETALPGK